MGSNQSKTAGHIDGTAGSGANKVGVHMRAEILSMKTLNNLRPVTVNGNKVRYKQCFSYCFLKWFHIKI